MCDVLVAVSSSGISFRHRLSASLDREPTACPPRRAPRRIRGPGWGRCSGNLCQLAAGPACPPSRSSPTPNSGCLPPWRCTLGRSPDGGARRPQCSAREAAHRNGERSGRPGCPLGRPSWAPSSLGAGHPLRCSSGSRSARNTCRPWGWPLPRRDPAVPSRADPRCQAVRDEAAGPRSISQMLATIVTVVGLFTLCPHRRDVGAAITVRLVAYSVIAAPRGLSVHSARPA